VDVPKQVLAEYSPEARTFPYIRSEEQISLLKKISQFPSLGDKVGDSWVARPYRELDRTNDSDRFVSEEADYPVLGGNNIHQFAYDPQIIDEIDSPEFWSPNFGRLIYKSDTYYR